MFFDRDIKGDLLPRRTLCLTYDDGPGVPPRAGSDGPDTRELGRYLHAEGIGATFFAVGLHAEGHGDLLRQLRQWGHLVGNHTWSHPGLVALALSGGDVVGEVERADAVLGENGREQIFLRAPYGNWRETEGPGGRDKPVSLVAGLLNASGRFPSHVGPVNWDVCAEDWKCWQQGLSAKEAARRYLEQVEHRGRGIVLMHDSSEEAAVRPRNRTVQMTKLLVPVLKRRGYRFVRLDEVPQVRSAARVTSQLTLRTADGRYVRCRESGAIATGFTRDSFGVVPVCDGRVALRAANGRYLSARGGRVAAAGVTVTRGEVFAIERLPGAELAFRTAGGRFLSAPLDGDGLATARRCGVCERFAVEAGTA